MTSRAALSTSLSESHPARLDRSELLIDSSKDVDSTVDGDATYKMGDVLYTYDELVDALNAEAATLPPETWRDGVGTSTTTSPKRCTSALSRPSKTMKRTMPSIRAAAEPGARG